MGQWTVEQTGNTTIVNMLPVRSTYAKAYLSCLDSDTSAQLFPSHWEFDSCAIREWW